MKSNRWVLWALFALLLPFASLPMFAAAARPNIVFFFIDDLGWRDLGCMGSQYYETPNTDRLAAEGVRFTQAYANAPNCAPSRACLMSGQYTPRHGIYTVGNSDRGPARLRKLVPIPNETTLADGFVTLAESLRAAGYVTAAMGKWHLGEDPTTQGFDVNVAGNHSGSPQGGYFSPYKNPQLSDGPKGEYLTDRLTDEALKFLEQQRENPFFLYLSHYAVHTPLQAKADKIAKYKTKPGDANHNNPTYAAMVESADESVGRVLAKLDELKLRDNTLVIFFSDNGGYGPATSMTPLRGSKGMLYEGGIRVPLIVRWPGSTRAGTTCEVPVIGIDLYPTLLEATGSPRPAGLTLDGLSLVPLLKGKKAIEARALYWHFPAYLQAYSGMTLPFRTRPAGAVRLGDWKLIEFFEDGRLELYNLRDDLSETTNLAASQPQMASDLHALMQSWRMATRAPIPTEPNPDYDAAADRKARGE